MALTKVTSGTLADDAVTSDKLSGSINITTGNSLTVDSGATVTNNGTANGFLPTSITSNASAPSGSLDIDSSGIVTKPNTPAFNATKSTSTGGSFEIVYQVVYLNNGNNYSNSTGRFTAPVDGLYHFAAATDPNSGTTYAVRLAINGSIKQQWWTSGNDGTLTGTFTWQMSAGDYASVFTSVGAEAYLSHFNGFLIG